MGRSKTVTNELRNLIIESYKRGIKKNAIANNFNINKSTVTRIIQRFSTIGTPVAFKSPGRLRKTTKRTDRKILKISATNPFLSSEKILGILPKEDRNKISSRTIRRRLLNAGMFSRRPTKKPLLSKKNVKARLEFAQNHVNWTIEQWARVIFSDETKFNLVSSDGVQHVRGPVGKRLDPKYTVPTVKHGGGSVMVWGCFSSYGMGPLHRIEGIMDKYMYKDILKNVMEQYADEYLPLKHIFQHDNVPKHASKIVKQWLEMSKIEVMLWPSQSPDLNPIGNLWEIVDRQIRNENYTNKDQLFRALERAWSQIDDKIIANLIESMPRRCRDVINANGYYT